VERIPDLLIDYRGRMSFDPKGTPSFLLHYKKCGVIEKDEELLLSLTEETVADMERYLLQTEVLSGA
jgi:hypothetical protein